MLDTPRREIVTASSTVTRKSVESNNLPCFGPVLSPFECTICRAKLKRAAEFALTHCIKIINLCFGNGAVPVGWNTGVIRLITKSDSKDPRNLLSYRGICLTLKCLSIGTPNAINFPFVSNEK